MKVLGNAAVLFVALTIMGGLLLAQRSYQNSWHASDAMQTSASTVTIAGSPNGLASTRS
jgi:hypothetical protein